jgi:uncharacterized protein YndB with AHSA1/START domain
MMNHEADHAVTKSIVVDLDPARAFQVWTEHISAWWPSGHSLSGDPRTQVFIEGKVGGRFYERASDGTEYDWGAVAVWDPPHRLAHTWHLGSNREMPTRVEVQFVPLSQNRTRIDLEHRGPELIGELWSQRVGIFNTAWETILARFAAFLTSAIGPVKADDG